LPEAAEEFEQLAEEHEAPMPAIIGAAHRNGNAAEAQI
jgi:hypothetical protein